MNFHESLLFAALSDQGKEREENQDALTVFDWRLLPVRQAERGVLFVVADGMGGHRGGQQASRLACETMAEYFTRPIKNQAILEQIPVLLHDSIMDAHQAVLARAEQEPALRGMGTTLTAAVIYQDQLFIGHVGDSRLYLLRRGEWLEHAEYHTPFLTEDHSVVGEMVRMGRLSLKQAEGSQQRNTLTQAVGAAPTLEVYGSRLTLMRGDLVLLCSDGLYTMIPERTIKETLLSVNKLELSLVCQKLVDQANAAGGHDNITVLLIRV